MDFKKIIYDNYVEMHTRGLYGKASLDLIKKSFSAWRYYYNKILPVNKNAIILDIGCGNGGFVYFLHKQGYIDSHGIDISLQQIDEGHKLGISNIECVDLYTFLSERINCFDCIIARDVLEHFKREDIFRILFLVNNSLKKDGVFIMQSPNAEGIFYSSILYGDFTHEIAFTENSIKQIFSNTGFKNIICYPTGPVPKSFFSHIRWFLWQLLVLKTKFYKAIETGSSRGIFTQNLIAKSQKN